MADLLVPSSLTSYVDIPLLMVPSFPASVPLQSLCLLNVQFWSFPQFQS